MTSNYHMIEYIYENADALQRTFDVNEQNIERIIHIIKDRDINKIIVSGVGSSYTAALMAYPLFRYFSALPVHLMQVNELLIFKDQLLNEKTMVFIISRSGERAWVINTMKAVMETGAFGVAITGAADSLLAESGDMTLLTGEGPEITYPKTKSVTACAGLLMKMAIEFSMKNDEEVNHYRKSLSSMPLLINEARAETEQQVKSVVSKIKHISPVVLGGTASNYGVAMEAACKIQESTFLPAIGENTVNVLYGPLSPLSENWLLGLLVNKCDEDLSKELLEVAGKSKFHATRMVVCSKNLKMDEYSDLVIHLQQEIDPMLSALLFLPPLQMLAYYWTVERGMNPDEPSTMRDMLDAFLLPGREEPELRNIQNGGS